MEIDFTEFLALMAASMESADEIAELQEAFRVFDKERDGYISVDELLEVRAAPPLRWRPLPAGAVGAVEGLSRPL